MDEIGKRILGCYKELGQKIDEPILIQAVYYRIKFLDDNFKSFCASFDRLVQEGHLNNTEKNFYSLVTCKASGPYSHWTD